MSCAVEAHEVLASLADLQREANEAILKALHKLQPNLGLQDMVKILWGSA